MILSNIDLGAHLRLPLDTQNNEWASASGGFAPESPTGGSAPWTPAGGSSQDPRYRLALRARHGVQLNPVQF